MVTMNTRAYAKVNLGLHIVGKRPDGFHDIETIFHRIDLFDGISLAPADRISITCSHPDVPTDRTNHCWKAVELLQQELGCHSGAAISITKWIPMGAGLGGGSSDGAAVLSMLPSLWNVPASAAVLERVALAVGSDVPYFLQNGSAYAEGRGERLQPFRLSLPYWIVLVNPNIHVSTPWAYRTLSEHRNGSFPSRPRLWEAVHRDPLQAILTAGNDFEEVVFAAHPAIGQVKTSLMEQGALHAVMSGSGSSVFGLYTDEQKARESAASFRNQYFVHVTEPNFVPTES